MSLPYSKRVIKYTGTATPPATVPSGKRWIIHQLTFVVDGSSAVCSASFAVPPGEAFFYKLSDAGTTSYQEWQGREVLFAGESFEMSCSSPCAFTAMVYELDDP